LALLASAAGSAGVGSLAGVAEGWLALAGGFAAVGWLELAGAVAAVGWLELAGALAAVGWLELAGALAAVGWLELAGALAAVGWLALAGALAAVGWLALAGAVAAVGWLAPGGLALAGELGAAGLAEVWLAMAGVLPAEAWLAGFCAKFVFNPETMFCEPGLGAVLGLLASAEIVARSLAWAGALAVVREVLAELEDDLLAGAFERDAAELRVVLAELDRVEVAAAIGYPPGGLLSSGYGALFKTNPKTVTGILPAPAKMLPC